MEPARRRPPVAARAGRCASSARRPRPMAPASPTASCAAPGRSAPISGATISPPAPMPMASASTARPSARRSRPASPRPTPMSMPRTMREIDILDDLTFAAHQGGFAAAARRSRRRAPALYHADLSDPDRPTLRPLAEEVARVVQRRAANPAWIAGMMRHGYRGAAEMANAVDALFAFAATAGVVTDAAFDRIHAAYLEDDAVRDFLEGANPAAARAIRARLAEAVRRGLWKPRRNSVAAARWTRRNERRRPSRAGAPARSAPMRTGDGLLVRVRVTGGVADAGPRGRPRGAWRARHGNGLIDLTSRANLQLRGVVARRRLAPLQAELDAAGLLDRDAGIRARPQRRREPARRPRSRPAIPPSPASPRALEDALVAAPELHALPAKFGFLLDGGGALPLDGVEADMRFVAGPDGRFAVEAGGRADRPRAARTRSSTRPCASRGRSCASAGGDERRMREVAHRLPHPAQARPASDRRHAPPTPREPERRRDFPARPRGPALSPLPDSGRLAPAGRRRGGSPSLPPRLRPLRPPRRRPAPRARRPRRGGRGGASPHALARASPRPAAGRRRPADIARLGLVVDAADPRLAFAACPGSAGCAVGRGRRAARCRRLRAGAGAPPRRAR